MEQRGRKPRERLLKEAERKEPETACRRGGGGRGGCGGLRGENQVRQIRQARKLDGEEMSSSALHTHTVEQGDAYSTPAICTRNREVQKKKRNLPSLVHDNEPHTTKTFLLLRKPGEITKHRLNCR